MVDKAPAGGDKWINPATVLPDQAPNLDELIVDSELIYGESIKSPHLESRDNLDVLLPSPNIHSRPSNGSPLSVIWGGINTSTDNVNNNGETVPESHNGQTTKPRMFTPWEDVCFHGSHVR